MREYGQYCGLAKALGRIGGRWTLLIVRELLVGPRRFTELRRDLPGVPTNLLAARLRELTADGVIAAERGGETERYVLTDLGRRLGPAILELIWWGGAWMQERAPRDVFRPAWLVLAIRSILAHRHPKRALRVGLVCDGLAVAVEAGPRRIDVRATGPDADVPALVLEGSAPAVLGAFSGALPWTALRRIAGPRSALAALELALPCDSGARMSL